MPDVAEDVSKADFGQYYHNERLKLPLVDVIHFSASDVGWWTWDKTGDPYWRLYWNPTPGAYVLWGDGQKTLLGPDKFVLLAPNMAIGMRNTGRMKQLYIHFVASPPFHNPVPKVWEAPVSAERRNVFSAMYNHIMEGRDGQKFVLNAYAWIAEALALVPQQDWTVSTMDPHVHDAIREIEMRLAEPLTVERLASVAKMSTAAFSRLFRRETGMPPHSYLLARRVEMAACLLKQRQMSIDEVAAQSGFCDRYHFTKVFSRVYGMAPAAYRRKIFQLVTEGDCNGHRRGVE